jgi:hypothetical protein
MRFTMSFTANLLQERDISKGAVNKKIRTGIWDYYFLNRLSMSMKSK